MHSKDQEIGSAEKKHLKDNMKKYLTWTKRKAEREAYEALGFTVTMVADEERPVCLL